MDEEELQKRFTDCVYFLASPLTCKKGIECEYRHSEIARLNPRDCWYWLGGCCFNPECAFRHPPLEGIKEAYSESSHPNNDAALPVDKTNIPCYFYSKGICNKGDRCSFLHGSADGTIAWKSSKAVPSEKKLSAGSNTGLPPVEDHPNPSETAQIENTVTESKAAQHSQNLALESPERSESSDISPDISDSLLLQEEFVQSESDHFIDQNSDQQADDYVERERWLDASSGFDVLVEGESEHLGYERSEFDVHYAEYDHADHIEYDPDYPALQNPLSEERYDVYDVGNISGKSRESIFYRLSFQKRNFQVEPIFNNQRGSDLREHLKKRKLYDSPCLVDHRISSIPRRHGSCGEINIAHRGWLRKTVPMNRYRQPLKDKRPGKPRFLFSEVSRSRKAALQQKRNPWEESAIFTGPKTLEQIKEEKKKALQNGDLSGKSDGFQGPRPLSEILKNKRKLS